MFISSSHFEIAELGNASVAEDSLPMYPQCIPFLYSCTELLSGVENVFFWETCIKVEVLDELEGVRQLVSFQNKTSID